VSNAIQYDPLLVHYLAAELDQRLRGRACAAALVFGGGRSALLPLAGGEAVALELHPRHARVRVVPWQEEEEALEAECGGVEAVRDERVLVVHLRVTDRFRPASRRLVVELPTNQWNALLLDETDRILSVLWSRQAGDRVLRSGATYRPPPPPRRYGVEPVREEEAWRRWGEEIGSAPPPERRGALLRGFAFTGAPNADFILGTAAEHGSPAALEEAFHRWWWLRSLPEPRPVLLRQQARLLPYPVPLSGVDAMPVPSLLAGMDRVAAEAETARPEAAAGAIAALIEQRVAAAERKASRLREQLARAAEVDRLRGWGDLLLARLHLVPRGAEQVRLENWDGSDERIALDPSLTPAENAARLYDEARRRERAAAQVPALLEEAERELWRWRAAGAAAEAGEVPEWVEAELARPEAETRGTAPGAALPYRRYRTSGGLEVRVGRSSRGNDELTFGHSSPNDVWLHARSVPGSHVILRWPDADGAPPARDLSEAATLAALFSKARSSALVAVDWTRRKHVRKPRGAAAGAVIPQRVKTLFVEPDPAAEERLRRD
jgi:hypothetical protein